MTYFPFQPSPQQIEVFNWVAHGTGNGMIVAVAGSGKTTTLTHALRFTKGQVIFAAFNKAASEDIQAKVNRLDREGSFEGKLKGRVACSTMHSLGYGALAQAIGKFQMNEKARREQLTALAMQLFRDHGSPYTRLPSKAFQLFDLARGQAIDPRQSHRSQLQDLIDHHDLNQPTREEREGGERPVSDTDLCIMASALLVASLEPTTVIDFTDMIYLPVVMGYQPKQADWVFLDECQDTNPARRMLARMALRKGGRFVAVGDPYQAIYGFTGASSDSMELIAREFQTTEMHLTTTYRCPKAVVAHAQQWVGHIQAHESAPEGTVEFIEASAMDPQIGDAILCRKTAPVVKMAFQLIRQGKPAHVEGREIGRGLIALTEKWRISDIGQFFTKLRDWAEVERASLISKGRDMAADALDDRVATLEVIAENCGSLQSLRERIEAIFDNTEPSQGRSRITLATIHRAKGREWDTVYWLGHDEYSPSPMAKKDWELQQEDNLCYVAATRSKDRLVLVN
jgi:superfamily I DNA/RNA helicase